SWTSCASLPRRWGDASRNASVWPEVGCGFARFAWNISLVSQLSACAVSHLESRVCVAAVRARGRATAHTGAGRAVYLGRLLELSSCRLAAARTGSPAACTWRGSDPPGFSCGLLGRSRVERPVLFARLHAAAAGVQGPLWSRLGVHTTDGGRRPGAVRRQRFRGSLRRHPPGCS